MSNALPSAHPLFLDHNFWLLTADGQQKPWILFTADGHCPTAVFRLALVVLVCTMHTVGQISTAQLYGSCLLLLRQLSFACSAVVFCCLGSCFFISSSFLRTRQLCFACSAVVFCLGSCVLLVRQLLFDRSVVVFLTFRQLCFDRSAVVFCWFGSCFLPVQQLFFVGSTVVLCCPTHIVDKNWTVQLPNCSKVVICLFGSCALLKLQLPNCQTLRQLFYDFSAVAF